MKTQLKYTVLALWTAICLQGSLATASVGTRGGGNVYAAEFSEIAVRAITKISVLRPVVINGFEVNGYRLQDVFAKTQVFAIDRQLVLKGKPVNAVNDHQNLQIFFNQNAWQRLNDEQKMQLVLHELMGLTFPEVSDLNYTYSSQLLQLIQSNSGRDIKVHCRLSVENQKTSDYDVVDESMTWVVNGASANDMLGNFGIEFSLKDAYLRILLKNQKGQLVVNSNQYIAQSFDFETRTPFKTVLDGKSYDTLILMCEEALGRTP